MAAHRPQGPCLVGCPPKRRLTLELRQVRIALQEVDPILLAVEIQPLPQYFALAGSGVASYDGRARPQVLGRNLYGFVICWSADNAASLPKEPHQTIDAT